MQDKSTAHVLFCVHPNLTTVWQQEVDCLGWFALADKDPAFTTPLPDTKIPPLQLSPLCFYAAQAQDAISFFGFLVRCLDSGTDSILPMLRQ